MTTRMLNYTTEVAAQKSVAELTNLLVGKGASEILQEYGPDAILTGLKWSLNTKHGKLGFAMPANVNGVFDMLTRERVRVKSPEARRAQAERTAWRNVLVWTKAQLALLEAQQATFEEIFLPYMLVDNVSQTLIFFLYGTAGIQGAAAGLMQSRLRPT